MFAASGGAAERIPGTQQAAKKHMTNERIVGFIVRKSPEEKKDRKDYKEKFNWLEATDKGIAEFRGTPREKPVNLRLTLHDSFCPGQSSRDLDGLGMQCLDFSRHFLPGMRLVGREVDDFVES